MKLYYLRRSYVFSWMTRIKYLLHYLHMSYLSVIITKGAIGRSTKVMASLNYFYLSAFVIDHFIRTIDAFISTHYSFLKLLKITF